MNVIVLATLFSAFLLALVVPGQDFVTVVRLSVSRSMRVGVGAAAGSATGLVLWGLAAMAGVSALLDQFPGLSRALRLAGAAVLVAFGLYSAVRALRAPPQSADLAAAPRTNSGYAFARGWRAGLLSNLSNVKLLIFFTTLFSSLLPVDLTVPEAAAILSAMGLLAFGWFSLIALLGSRPRISGAYQRASRPLDVLFGLIFVVIGAVLLGVTL